MSDVRMELRKMVKEGSDPEAAADVLLSKLRKADLASYVRPLLVMEASRWVRRETRALEDEVEARIAHGEDPIAARRKLSESYFSTPDGRFVPWLDATVDDHRARAGWQRTRAMACLGDAQRHDEAADAIEVAGVSCLRDLETIDQAEGAA